MTDTPHMFNCRCNACRYAADLRELERTATPDCVEQVDKSKPLDVTQQFRAAAPSSVPANAQPAVAVECDSCHQAATYVAARDGEIVGRKHHCGGTWVRSAGMQHYDGIGQPSRGPWPDGETEPANAQPTDTAKANAAIDDLDAIREQIRKRDATATNAQPTLTSSLREICDLAAHCPENSYARTEIHRIATKALKSIDSPEHEDGLMSWSIQYTSKDDLNNDKRAVGSAKDEDLSDEAKEQVEMAIESAVSIIAGGEVGGPDKDFFVSIAGHANPKHEPASGWANDTITVSVTQRPAMEAGEDEANAGRRGLTTETDDGAAKMRSALASLGRESSEPRIAEIEALMDSAREIGLSNEAVDHTRWLLAEVIRLRALLSEREAECAASNAEISALLRRIAELESTLSESSKMEHALEVRMMDGR